MSTAFASLTHERARAVVINVGTEMLATLALGSARLRADMPVLLVNCAPTAASRAHFAWLADAWGFDVIEQPLRTHGATLDLLFDELSTDLVLLLDSDAEIRNDTIIATWQADFADPAVFGAGFVEGPMWLDPSVGIPERTCLFQERPWVPCVMLRAEHIRDARAAGRSFEVRTVFNDVGWSPRVSRLLALRFQNGLVPRSRVLRRAPEPVRRWLARRRLPWLAWARRPYAGYRPNLVYCDTGAEVYQWCRYEAGHVFVGPPNAQRTGADVVHYKGSTRRRLGYGAPGMGRLGDLDELVVERLAVEHDLDWSWCERRVADA